MTILAPTNHQATGLLERTRHNKYVQHTRIHIQDALGQSQRLNFHSGEFGPTQSFVWPRIATCQLCNLYTVLKVSTESVCEGSGATSFYFRVIRQTSGILNYGQSR
jgi:hypothetical protein